MGKNDSFAEPTDFTTEKCFVATGSSGDKHLFRLFHDGKPSQHFTCKSTVTLPYIMAARLLRRPYLNLDGNTNDYRVI